MGAMDSRLAQFPARPAEGLAEPARDRVPDRAAEAWDLSLAHAFAVLKKFLAAFRAPTSKASPAQEVAEMVVSTPATAHPA